MHGDLDMTDLNPFAITRKWPARHPERWQLYRVLDRHPAGRGWMMGAEYGIADIAIRPWMNKLVGCYGAPGWPASTASMSASSALAPRRKRRGESAGPPSCASTRSR